MRQKPLYGYSHVHVFIVISKMGHNSESPCRTSHTICHVHIYFHWDYV